MFNHDVRFPSVLGPMQWRHGWLRGAFARLLYGISSGWFSLRRWNAVSAAVVTVDADVTVTVSADQQCVERRLVIVVGVRIVGVPPSPACRRSIPGADRRSRGRQQ